MSADSKVVMMENCSVVESVGSWVRHVVVSKEKKMVGESVYLLV